MLLIGAVVLFGATGCIQITSKTESLTSQAGIFISKDFGETWANSSSLMTAGATPGTIAAAETLMMEFDPIDEKAIYIGTRKDGMLFSYNSGTGWNYGLTVGVPRGVAIDPSSHCTIYAAVDSWLKKTTDCSRKWDKVYYTGDDSRSVTAVTLDLKAPKTLWVGLSTGEILKSPDAGKSWSKKTTLKSRVAKILLSGFDSKVIYAASLENGISKSTDAGETWQKLDYAFANLGTNEIYYYRGLIEDGKKAGTLYYASAVGLFKTTTGGQEWTAMNLLTPSDQANIYSIAVDPNNSNNLYYGTTTSFYRSKDGGNSWIAKKMPTTLAASVLKVHPKISGVLYMGVKSIK